ncbi:hypothetical protein PIB30_096881 [Stylosanthes scabra]|uniref:Uncharacterized protein n=1 Tax=Stylosanthes scabra TaxID=79078 RepID=A0ABU6TWV9_9FABA|nr:hypothetical protein [Stylosanthes scabra]
MARKASSPLAKGKALRARQPTEKVRPSNTAPAIPDLIIISSDSEEKDLEMDPEGEDPAVDSVNESEEVSEYIPEAEAIEEEKEVPDTFQEMG